ncbi:angiopoietin-related protein 7-like [Ylistrum balloti]|uniref:angiopoietin-related protein 7-like n=1 Tax=Ylistrum balloti TaxID=509963 RepID=UPI002905DB7D|nr:angiopoietin-related protein 7-like [Ylistrum balloti]
MDPSIYCSGVYRITPSPGVSFDVYCDFDTVNGTWTVIQNRQSGEENFFRSWASYKTGFGNLKGNFWLGNDNISNLTLTPSILRVEATSWYGDARYAQYSTFKVENEVNKYRLTVSGFSGNANYDAMALHNGMAFSTYERDNDMSSSNCADTYKGAWWYKSCYDCNLNGREYQNGTDNFQSLIWDWFYPNIQYPQMMTTKMLVKRQGT